MHRITRVEVRTHTHTVTHPRIHLVCLQTEVAAVYTVHLSLSLSPSLSLAIIITAPLNDESTLRWLRQGEWARQQHTKVLLIDIVASSLNVEHRFYKYLARIDAATNGNANRNRNGNANGNVNGNGNGSGSGSGNGSMPQSPPAAAVSGLVSSNLLVLTLLSDKHRHYLNASDMVDAMAMVRNFRAPASYASSPSPMEREEEEAMQMEAGSPQQLRPFMNLFSLYDFLLSHIGSSNGSDSGSNATMAKYDFMVLDIVADAKGSTYKWRPLLILEHGLGAGALGVYITHSIQPGYDEWLLVSSIKMWHCGAICWTIAAICMFLLVIVVAASVAVGIAVR